MKKLGMKKIIKKTNNMNKKVNDRKKIILSIITFMLLGFFIIMHLQVLYNNKINSIQKEVI